MNAVISEMACTCASDVDTAANTVGMPRPITASASIEAFMPASRRSKLCTPLRRPPTRNDSPSTSSVLPRIDPVIAARATSISPAEMANMVMISSAALPKVAFSTPPTRGPALSPSCSVEMPTIQASISSASAASTNCKVLGAPARSEPPATSASAAAAARLPISVRVSRRVTGPRPSHRYSTHAPISRNLRRRSARR